MRVSRVSAIVLQVVSVEMMYIKKCIPYTQLVSKLKPLFRAYLEIALIRHIETYNF